MNAVRTDSLFATSSLVRDVPVSVCSGLTDKFWGLQDFVLGVPFLVALGRSLVFRDGFGL